MPVYVLECGSCGHIEDYAFGTSDPRVASCRECGTKFNADGNRRYDLEGLNIQGDTCAGGLNYSGYYDEGMGEYVLSRDHRKRLMKEKGLEEYSPDPEYKKHRDEAKYLRKHARPGDPEAAAAARKELKTAASKRTDRAIKSVMDKVEV